MDKWTFGLTMMIVGVSGTFLTLWILSLVIGLMKRMFPLVTEDSTPENRP
jgi:Na+-transporting methylmalonyl-CoA/oxaloacetate decarboxylase gamma subunit